VCLSFTTNDEGMNGLGRVITGLTSNNKLLNITEFYPEEGYKNVWLGRCKEKEEEQYKLVAWGFSRFCEKYFTDFDIGGGELFVNYKYAENGWSDSFSKKEYINKQAEEIPMSDYSFLKVKSKNDIIENWEEIVSKLEISAYGIRYDQLNLGCVEK